MTPITIPIQAEQRVSVTGIMTEDIIESLFRKRKRGQAFDLGVTNILQGSKKLGTAEQPTRPRSSG